MIDEEVLLEKLEEFIEYDTFDYAQEEPKIVMTFEELEKVISNLPRLEKTDKFNRMIEAFECDFALIEQGKMTFAELDRLLKDKRNSLVTDMDLMQELSYLLRYGKVVICMRGKEND